MGRVWFGWVGSDWVGSQNYSISVGRAGSSSLMQTRASSCELLSSNRYNMWLPLRLHITCFGNLSPNYCELSDFSKLNICTTVGRTFRTRVHLCRKVLMNHTNFRRNVNKVPFKQQITNNAQNVTIITRIELNRLTSRKVFHTVTVANKLRKASR